MCLKTDDLDLQGRIGLETSKFCLNPSEWATSEPLVISASNLSCVLII